MRNGLMGLCASVALAAAVMIGAPAARAEDPHMTTAFLLLRCPGGRNQSLNVWGGRIEPFRLAEEF